MLKSLRTEEGRAGYVIRLFGPSFALRRLPVWVKYTITCALMAGAHLFRISTADPSIYPVVLYIPVAVLCAILLDHGSGLLAVTLASALAIGSSYYYGDLHEQSLLLVVGLGSLLFTALAIEALAEVTHTLKLQSERLQRSDADKALQIRETIHRTRNDMATLSAMIRLQSKGLGAEAKASLDAVTHRLGVLMRVQQRLTVSEDHPDAAVQTDTFLNELIDELRLTYVGPITVNTMIERHWLPHSSAVAVGLIVNEAMTNAIKYAFPLEGGEINVTFSHHAGECGLIVRDNGVNDGMVKGTGLGTKLIEAMVAQIGGKLTIERQGGTTVQAIFPCAQ